MGDSKLNKEWNIKPKTLLFICFIIICFTKMYWNTIKYLQKMALKYDRWSGYRVAIRDVQNTLIDKYSEMDGR